ncbi:MAG TPA: acylphosphatase [Thermoguttaceae bacterium]|nr:acylphosphatase [Thermoguttaceae bacterium]
MPDDDRRERREIHYSGRVQGVGFRYTVRSLAARFDVTGFVRNLSDGRVQLVVEGSVPEVGRFLDTIATEMGHYIADTRSTTESASGRFERFEIRF